jgi:hypothetical protein
MDSAAAAMSHAPEELVGHVDRLQRSLLFTHFRLEQGADQCIYRRFAPRPSRDKTDVFMQKDAIDTEGRLRALVDNAKAAAQGCCGWPRNAGEMGVMGE